MFTMPCLLYTSSTANIPLTFKVWDDTPEGKPKLLCVAAVMPLLESGRKKGAADHIAGTFRENPEEAANAVDPVSYTHLDVYKRQMLSDEWYCTQFWAAFSYRMETVESESGEQESTRVPGIAIRMECRHKDVYKRQALRFDSLRPLKQSVPV